MQKTIHEDPREVWELVGDTLGCELEPARGMNGYERQMVLTRAHETLARVMYGGPNGWPNVITSGAQTDEVAPILLAFERAEVTRMDSAADFVQPGGFDRVRAELVALHERSGVSKYEIESTRNGVRSRTFYLGAPSSRVRLRLYEKGQMERQMGHEADEDWFRMEVQIRPTGDARATASTLDASEAWGFSRWTRDLASIVMQLDIPQVVMQLRREPDFMRALRHLQVQYGPTLTQALENEGSWEAVGRLLGFVEAPSHV